MQVDVEVELRLVVAEGILARTEAEALGLEAARAGQGLLARLQEDGTISAARCASLRARLADVTLAASPSSSARALSEPRPPAARDRPPSLPTLDLRGDAPPAAVDGFPVPGWDRYRPIRLLGEGGMGRVFLACDLRLDRNVAIKFVRGDDAELARRVVAEARAQARVNDDRVCKVYEVGEVDGRVYIAMQHVDGAALPDLVGTLTYEQKALVMRGAALGVHEAHRAGLIHRDLKPSNIMVERGGDGALRPFVMDFGIARDWSDSATVTGTVLGTPQFMAPEQARGEVKQLDRRADVYSLGATLYAFLTGRAPIEGDNPLVVLNRISIDAPDPLRSIDPDVPPDLDAIVMKCLEKERAGRYESARALADDLGRFLDGAPVEARSTTSLAYRLRKAARRHWRALAVTGAMLAIIAVALGFGLRERWAAERRAVLARRFTERVERIEALARYSALAPLHDLTNDRAQIRAQMAELEDEIHAAGAAAAGTGHYALGRGYSALGDDERALAELQAAWDAGVHDPRAAYALAITEGRMYQRALRDLERLPATVREQRRPAIEWRYRDPARTHLLASAGTVVPSRAYVAALLAYYEGRYDDALHELDGIATSTAALAWFYEAPLLRGQILHERALAGRRKASDAQLDAQFDAARAALASAAAIGESEPSLFLAIAELEHAIFAIELYGRGQVDESFRRGVEAATRALTLVPDDVDALLVRARFQRGMAEYRGGRGEDAAAPLTQAIADARRAVALAPASVDAKVVLAGCLREDGANLQAVGQDPGPALAQAHQLLETIAPRDRDERMLSELGLVHHIWADYLDEAGADATAQRRQAIDAYRGALAVTDRNGQAWLNLGINYLERARHVALTAPDGDDDLAKAIDALERGRALQPQSLVPDFHQGDAYELRARRAQARGADPEPDWAAAIARYEHGLTINPDLALLHNGICIVEVARAVAARTRGADPTAILVRAEAAARRAIAAAPDQSYGYNNLAEVLIERGQGLRARRGATPLADEEVTIEAASAAVARALELIPDHATFLYNAAELDLMRTRLALDRHRDARPALAAARVSVARAKAAATADTRDLERDLAALVQQVAGTP
ncbi:MAG: protein kinase [Myxococcales bacterium]|nr:protein kinase [Myxococcales bacterium]